MMSEREEHTHWQAERRASVTSATGNLALVETRWTGERPRPGCRAACRIPHPERDAAPAHGHRDRPGGTRPARLGCRCPRDPRIRPHRHVRVRPGGGCSRATSPPSPVTAGSRSSTSATTAARASWSSPATSASSSTAASTTSPRSTTRGTLLLVFGDETNGSETYGSGRFLFVQLRDDEGSVTLDFNRAFVPPCGFSAQYNCPLPPASNRFPLPIRAGEKNVVFRDGFDIYAA